MNVVAPSVPFVEWDAFFDSFSWRQGEHVTMLGPTGAGKTTLALAILKRRAYVIVLAAKPEDPVVSSLRDDGYKIVRRLPLAPYELYPRQVFWPSIDSPDKLAAQRDGFAQIMADVYRQGRWCLYIDEVQYVMDREFLGLAPLGKLLWQQGRSLKVSIVGGTQRPAHIPLVAYSQASHLFFWNTNDAADLKRLREIGGRIDPKALQAAILDLDADSYETLYVDVRKGQMMRTLAPGR